MSMYLVPMITWDRHTMNYGEGDSGNHGFEYRRVLECQYRLSTEEVQADRTLDRHLPGFLLTSCTKTRRCNMNRGLLPLKNILTYLLRSGRLYRLAPIE